MTCGDVAAGAAARANRRTGGGWIAAVRSPPRPPRCAGPRTRRSRGGRGGRPVPGARRRAPAAGPGPGRRGPRAVASRRAGRAWDRPLTAYYLILGSSLLITVLGLVMVFSASQIQALQLRPARPRTSSASSSSRRSSAPCCCSPPRGCR